MNRERRFRGKRKDGKGWIVSRSIFRFAYNKDDPPVYTYMQYPGDHCTINQDRDGVTLENMTVHEIDQDTIGEYIGIKDRWEDEIFEGDVIRHYYDPETDDYELGVVFYDSDHCVFLRTSPGSRHPVRLASNGKYEIIGNIYDNPEYKEDSI